MPSWPLLTPSQLETHFKDKLLGISIGRGFGVLKGFNSQMLLTGVLSSRGTHCSAFIRNTLRC